MQGSRKSALELGPEATVAFRKAADFCAIQDRCIAEMHQKLQSWGVDRDSAENIIERLLKEGFIDEQRFASAFARGKFRNLHWGRIKIVAELRGRKINTALIAKAINEIDPDEYRETIAKLFARKMKELKSNTRENRFKVMRFLASKGFEQDLIREIVNED
jgi:regulatory protein